jgi:membrane protease YdiL (CAAX protease family)
MPARVGLRVVNTEPTATTPPERGSPLPDVPWSLLEALLVFGAGLVLAQLTGQALPLLVDPVTAQGIFFPLTLAVLAATAAGYIRLVHPGHVRELLGGLRVRGLHVLQGIGFGVVAFLVINLGFSLLIQLVANLTGGELPTVQEDLREATRDPRIGAVVVGSAVLIAPVAEELFFRGMVFQALRTKLGAWPGIGMSGFLFGAAHLFGSQELAGALYTFVVLSAFGMFLAWALNRTGTIAVPILMHMTFNGAAVLGILLVGR